MIKAVMSRILVWSIAALLALMVTVGNINGGVSGSFNLLPSAIADEIEEAAEEFEEDLTPGGEIQPLRFKEDTSLRDAMRVLSARFKKNIVPSVNVDGVLTVTRLHDVTFEEALKAILGHRFKYIEEGNFIMVYTAEEYKTIMEDPERMVYKQFRMAYITSAEAKKLIAPVLSASAIVQTTSDTQKGVPTSESISATVGDGGDTYAAHDILVVYDYPENIEKVSQVITSIDVRPQQVLVEAAILSVTLTEDTQFGVDWQNLDGPAVTALSGISAGGPDYFGSTNTSQVTKSGGITIGFSFGDIANFIRAVEEVTDVTVMAKPKILTVNKQLGQVYIGQKLGYREGDVITDGGATQEGSVKFLDTGTKLSIRPYIGNDGYIRIDIHPKDSTGSLNAEGVPDETSAELVTNIMVKDGQTIVIGGLFRDKMTSKRTQVPVLGDLPFVGGAFRGTADKVERQEVIVLLTPHIIEEPGEVEGDERADDISRARYGAKDQMQIINRNRIAEELYATAAERYLQGYPNVALKEVNKALEIYPTYLEAIRLRERIILELSDGDTTQLERLMLEEAEKKDTEYWDRRTTKR